MMQRAHSSRGRARLGRTFSVAFACSVVLLAFGGCHADNSIVGGTCAPGYVVCGRECVDTQTDALHCGACDVSCAGTTCALGVCGGAPITDASNDGAPSGSVDASTDGSSDAGPDDGSVADAGEGGALDGGDACPPPPYETAAACGACGIVCEAPNPVCRSDGAGHFACGLPCVAPLSACHGLCVDLDNDPENCGTCGKFCPSNLCATGQCQGSTPGDIVVIGHDYEAAALGSSQAKILTNAVFIPRSDPLRILSYEQFADAEVVKHVKEVIQSGAIGRAVAFTVSVDPSALTSAALAQKYDVVLVHDQRNANAATLAPVGASWVASLSAFAKAGGDIVVLDGAGGQGAMPSLVTSAGLLDLAGHTSLPPGTPVSIVAPADRVGTLVVSPYGTYAKSAALTPNEPEGPNVVYVARELVNGAPDAPVVVHKLVP